MSDRTDLLMRIHLFQLQQLAAIQGLSAKMDIALKQLGLDDTQIEYLRKAEAHITATAYEQLSAEWKQLLNSLHP